MKTIRTVALLILLTPVYGFTADTGTYGDYESPACKAELAKRPADRSGPNLNTCFGLLNNVESFARIAGGKALYGAFIQAIENARLDKQAGAAPGSSGTTSLVSKGAVPQALAFALERGAIARTQEGDVLTFRGNLGGMARLLSGGDAFPYCTVADDRCPQSTRVMDGISGSVSFDPSRTRNSGSTSDPLLFTGGQQQVANWSARFDFHTRRDTMSALYNRNWDAMVADTNLRLTAAQVLAQAKPFEDFMKTPAYTAWQNALISRLQSAVAGTVAEVEAIVDSAVKDLVVIAGQNIPDFDQKVRGNLDAYGKFLGTRDRLMDTVLHRVTFAFEYTQNRPVNEPRLSSLRFIVSGRPGGDDSLITANFALQFYENKPDNGNDGNVRDGQAALQWDRTLSSGSGVKTAFSVGYYWQYMKEDALLKIPAGKLAPGTAIELPGEASKLLNTKGSIHIAQSKFTVSLKNTGISIPMAVTWASRTELVKDSRAGANFGLSFDLDSILAKK